jgi:hypothetical protein
LVGSQNVFCRLCELCKGSNFEIRIKNKCKFRALHSFIQGQALRVLIK